jgi:Arm DNA-binding domain
MSISRNPKNNRWYVLVDVPAGPDGKRRRRGVGGFKTKREAKAAEAEALRRIRDGVFVECRGCRRPRSCLNAASSSPEGAGQGHHVR